MKLYPVIWNSHSDKCRDDSLSHIMPCSQYLGTNVLEEPTYHTTKFYILWDFNLKWYPGPRVYRQQPAKHSMCCFHTHWPLSLCFHHNLYLLKSYTKWSSLLGCSASSRVFKECVFGFQKCFKQLYSRCTQPLEDRILKADEFMGLFMQSKLTDIWLLFQNDFKLSCPYIIVVWVENVPWMHSYE
jgi:hypothetical protein